MAAKPSVRSSSRPRPAHLTSRRGFGCGNCTASSPQPLRCRVAPSGRAGSTRPRRLRLGVPGLRQLHLVLSAQKADLRAGLGSALWRTGGSGAAGRARGRFGSTGYAAATTHAHLAPRRRRARLWAARGPRATQTLRPVSSASGRGGPELQVRLSPGGICRLGVHAGDFKETIHNRPPRGHHCPVMGGGGWRAGLGGEGACSQPLDIRGPRPGDRATSTARQKNVP